MNELTNAYLLTYMLNLSNYVYVSLNTAMQIFETGDIIFVCILDIGFFCEEHFGYIDNSNSC